MNKLTQTWQQLDWVEKGIAICTVLNIVFTVLNAITFLKD